MYLICVAKSLCAVNSWPCDRTDKIHAILDRWFWSRWIEETIVKGNIDG